MENETTNVKRPSSISLISSFLILGGILSFWFVFRAGIQNFGIGNTIVFLADGIVWIVCGVGLRLMKKWAVYLFAIFAVVEQVYLVLAGKWNLFSLILFAVVVFVGYRNLLKMS